MNADNLEHICRLYKVDTVPTHLQLPQMIVFEEGEPVARYPPLQNGYPKPYKYIEREIIKEMQLEKRYYASAHS